VTPLSLLSFPKALFTIQDVTPLSLLSFPKALFTIQDVTPLSFPRVATAAAPIGPERSDYQALGAEGSAPPTARFTCRRGAP